MNNAFTLAALSFLLMQHSLSAAMVKDTQTISDEATQQLRINHTTFRIPEQYVSYYDEKNRSLLEIHFLLPDVTPIKPFSIGVIGENKPGQVANVVIQAVRWPNYDEYLDRLAAAGKLQTTDYGFGLRELPPETIIGADQTGPNPDAREFLGVVSGQRVLISCLSYRLGGLLLRCRYTLALPDYALSVDIPEAFLPNWEDILSKLIRYANAHEER